MIIKSSTSLRNDYNSISKLAHEKEKPVYTERIRIIGKVIGSFKAG